MFEITHVEPSFSEGDLVIRSSSSPNSYHRVHDAVLRAQPEVFLPEDLAIREGPFGPDNLWRITLPADISEITVLVEIAYYDPKFVTRRYNVHNLHLTRDILPITDRHRQLVVLRARVLEVLHGDWPQSLVGWDHLQSHIHGLSQALAQDTEPHSTYFHTLPNAAVALRLAREHQIPTILPSVFASIAMIPSMCNIDFDDVFTIPGFDHPARSNPRYRTVDWSLLDVQDMERIRQGQCWFRNQIRQIITVVSVSGSSYVLPDHAQCINALARLLTGDETVDHYFHANPLGLWKLIIDRSRAEGFGLCAECATLVSSYAGHSRQYVWDMLGQIFDL